LDSIDCYDKYQTNHRDGSADREKNRPFPRSWHGHKPNSKTAPRRQAVNCGTKKKIANQSNVINIIIIHERSHG
jgi:hypothetical protein